MRNRSTGQGYHQVKTWCGIARGFAHLYEVKVIDFDEPDWCQGCLGEFSAAGPSVLAGHDPLERPEIAIEHAPRPFTVHRSEDRLLDGVVFYNGWVAISRRRSRTGVGIYRSFKAFAEVHVEGTSARIEWLDGEPGPAL